jgi:hypothetical protein
MTAPFSVVSSAPPRARLAASLAVALGATLSMAQGAGSAPDAHRSASPDFSARRAHASEAVRNATPRNTTFTTHHVTTCADDGSAGSLRAIIGDVVNTVSGDVIDFTQLPMQCSTITLAPAGGVIQIHQDSLYLQGPGADQLTLDGGNQSSVLFHFGAGTLGISGITIANGLYNGSLAPFGGCIYSTANVSLVDSTVSHCSVTSTSLSSPAAGGGISAAGSLSLLNSKIADSHAFAQLGGNALGGGAFAGNGFVAHGSEISGNTAFAIGSGTGYGGGVVAGGSIDIESSTIAENSADTVGALELIGGPNYSATITNSTISSNIGQTKWGGIFTNLPTTLANSTVAFNRAPFGTTKKGDGLYAVTTAATITLKSSIIAGNWRADGQSDLDAAAGVTITGSNDLITSSAIGFPPNTITACPQLDPLLNNGGSTRTHALRQTSPAIDQGDAGTLTVDQRGAQRTIGAAADIGSVERQPGQLDERIFANGFDGLCDQ